MFEIVKKSHEQPILNTIHISNKKLKIAATVFPNLGGTIQELSMNSRQILDGISAREDNLEIYASKYNGSVLFPFPSRIPGGLYKYQGKKYQLDCNEAELGNALHGHIHDKSFELTKSSASDEEAVIELQYESSGEPGYPFPYRLKLIYTLKPTGLSMQVVVHNLGTVTMPMALGWHPYFNTPNLNKTELSFGSDAQFLFNDKMQYVGNQDLNHQLPLKVGEQALDDGFVLKNPEVQLKTEDWTMRMKFSSEDPNAYLQLYTPPSRKSIAVEPMTCIANCFNHGKGLLELSPKKEYNWHVEMSISS